MTTQRVRAIIAAAAAVVVIGIIIALYAYASSLKPYQNISEYSERYSSTLMNINADTGVFRERDYYVSTTNELVTPTNGELLINPIQLPDDEEEVPSVQLSAYSIENQLNSSLYVRLTNSKRTEERSGETPEVALVSLAFSEASSKTQWTSLTLYNNENKEELVDSALVFTGQSSNATNWGGHASLFLIDGALTDHAAAILPGVDIINDFDNEGNGSGLIYSNRPLSIGSLPSAAQDETASDALRTSAGLLSQEQSTPLTQRITGTDLIFSTPENTETVSSIQAPASPDGNKTSFTLEGGVISIDPDVTLVVGSAGTGSANPLIVSSGASSDSAGNTVTQGSIELSPRAIVVDGGTLILSDTSKGNIVLNTDIQVRNGGTLLLGNNVEINGNIFVFGGGTLEVLGSFELNGTPIALAPGSTLETSTDVQIARDQAASSVPGGIYIFSNTSLQSDGTPLGTGYFKASLLWMIDGSDGKDPIILSRCVHFLSAEGAPGYPLMYNEYSCEEAEGSAYLCGHLGKVEGVVAPEVVLGFSEDMALIEVFAPRE